MLTHDELKAKMLKNPAVRKEHARLEKKEFALLDLLLAARHETGLHNETLSLLTTNNS